MLCTYMGASPAEAFNDVFRWPPVLFPLPIFPPLLRVSTPQLKHSSKTANILLYFLTLFTETESHYLALASPGS